MATRIYFLPQRNDLDGMNVQVLDLKPNTSQKGLLDGEGQTHYIGACLDAPDVTKTNGNAFLAGSRSTLLDANPASSDTTGGGADSYSTATATFGLAAYLRERVAKDPGGANTYLTYANANTIAAAIRSAASAGTALTLTAINALLVATAGGATELTNAGGSRSFGTVEDILRILSGETYRSPIYTIVSDHTPHFLTLASRQTLVAAQATGTTGLTFVASGAFLTSLENGYSGRPVIAGTGILMASIGAGQLKALASDIVLKNPLFTYGSGGTAYDINGTSHIGDNGDWPATFCYDNQGNPLSVG